jgi:hypothetical protein
MCRWVDPVILQVTLEYRLVVVQDAGLQDLFRFWNGHSRMTNEQLQESLTRLEWCESENNKTWSREGSAGSFSLHHVGTGIVRRQPGEAPGWPFLRCPRETKDDWVHPAAHFEMAANFWMERPAYQVLHGIASPKVWCMFSHL